MSTEQRNIYSICGVSEVRGTCLLAILNHDQGACKKHLQGRKIWVTFIVVRVCKTGPGEKDYHDDTFDAHTRC